MEKYYAKIWETSAKNAGEVSKAAFTPEEATDTPVIVLGYVDGEQKIFNEGDYNALWRMLFRVYARIQSTRNAVEDDEEVGRVMIEYLNKYLESGWIEKFSKDKLYTNRDKAEIIRLAFDGWFNVTTTWSYDQLQKKVRILSELLNVLTGKRFSWSAEKREDYFEEHLPDRGSNYACIIAPEEFFTDKIRYQRLLGTYFNNWTDFLIFKVKRDKPIAPWLILPSNSHYYFIPRITEAGLKEYLEKTPSVPPLEDLEILNLDKLLT